MLPARPLLARLRLGQGWAPRSDSLADRLAVRMEQALLVDLSLWVPLADLCLWALLVDLSPWALLADLCLWALLAQLVASATSPSPQELG